MSRHHLLYCIRRRAPGDGATHGVLSVSNILLIKIFQTYPALLLGNQRTLPVVHNAALLGGNILAHLVLDSLALPLIDDLALGLGPGGALLLHDGRALLLVPEMRTAILHL